MFQSLVVALVLSQLDFCNSVLAGLAAIPIFRLQSAKNAAAARLIFLIRRCDRITDALVSFHWLRVPERNLLRISAVTYRSVRQCTELPVLRDTSPVLMM